MAHRLVLAVLALSWAATCHAGQDGSSLGRVKEFEHKLRMRGAGSQGLVQTDGTGDKQAWELLDRHVAFPEDGTCGTWAEDYKVLHKKMMNGEHPNPRFLVHHGIEGLSNRLSGIMTAFMTALLTNRAFLIVDDLLPFGFEPAEVDWRVPAGTSLQDDSRLSEVELNPEIPRGIDAGRNESEVNFFRYWITRDPDFPQDVKAAFTRPEMVIMKMSTNRNSVNKILNPEGTSPTKDALKYLGLTMENAHQCLLRFLLKPKKHVLAPILPALKRLSLSRKPSVCFHVRVNDYTAWNWKGEVTNNTIDEKTKAKLVAAFDCANKVRDTLPGEQKEWFSKYGATWLVLSNWLPVVQEAKKLYPNRVMASPVKPRHIMLDTDKRDAVKSAVQDWVLFSLCDYYFLSNSGFSKTSMAYNTGRKGVFKTPLYNPTPWKEPEEPGPVCHGVNQFQFEDLF